MPDTAAPDAAAAPESPAYLALMQQLDALQTLRYSDPRRALQQLAAMVPAQAGMASAEQALVAARRTMQQASAHVVLGEHAAALPLFEQMAAALQAPVLRDVAEPALARQVQRLGVSGANARAVLAQALGDQAGALRHYLQALDQARALGDARFQAHILVNLANTCEDCGLAAEALEHLREAIPLAEREGLRELLGDLHHNLGNALAAAGQPAPALAANQQALQIYREIGSAQKQRYALVAVAERHLEQGRAEAAADALAERATLPEDFQNRQYDAYAALLAGRVAAARGEPAAAAAAFGQALAISRDPLHDAVGQARALLALARLARDGGAAAEARTHVEQALALLAPTAASRDQMQAHELAYTLARARGDAEAALAHHEQFHAAYARCLNAESAARAQVLAVRHEIDLVRAEARRQQLENARLSEALAQISARLGGGAAGDVPWRGPARPEDLCALGLTRREAEVLYWVAQGKTNDDVAQILDTSLSTVKKHLLSIYGKLGVENRTAAALRARQGSAAG